VIRTLRAFANSNTLLPRTTSVGKALRGVPSPNSRGDQRTPTFPQSAQSAERPPWRSLQTFFASVAALCAVVLLSVASRAREPSPPEVEVKKLTVRPAAAPLQALRYVLLPELKDKTPGNAIQSYYRAFSPEWWGNINRDKDFYEKVQKWQDMPLKDLAAAGKAQPDRVRPKQPPGEGVDGIPLEELAAQAQWIKNFNALQEVDRGARRDHADWDLTSRLQQEGVNLLLPDLQSMRTFGNLLAIRARLEMAEGDFDKTVYTLQTGFALAKHCGEGPTLIHSLVGMAIGSMMFARVEELIQQPGAPNLYWALTTLPRSLIDMRNPIQGERIVFASHLPDLNDLEKGAMTVDQARAALDEWIGRLARLQEPGFRVGPEHRLVHAGWIALAYPRAKERLTAAGRNPEEINALPAAQVVLIDTLREYNRLRDEMFKGFYLPYREGRQFSARAEDELRRAAAESGPNLLLRVGLMTLPAVQKVQEASVRTERRIDFLRTIEAIRLHAAAHGGKPPAHLTEITAVPLPTDPVTGKPFDYEARGDTAILTAPPGHGLAKTPNNAWRYELTFVK
jgi:hypothetical protein